MSDLDPFARLREQLTARAEEESDDGRDDDPLHRYLRVIRRGDVVTGTVASVHRFGVFLRLDGEPVHPVFPGTGFVRTPDLTWYRFAAPEDVVEPGDRVTGEVLFVDLHQTQVSVSLKALQEDPWDRLTARSGDVVRGTVTLMTPVGAFVLVGDGAEGLVPVAELRGADVGEGQELTVRVLEIDRVWRRIRLTLAR
ncbi:S1 RNA-binding domain-containing protein [Streptomyces sp. NPDC003688]